MMRIVSAIALALCSIWLCCEPAFAERRVALVIGNSGYERVPRLSNPVNDASAMAEMFKRAGFDTVTLKLDLKFIEMRRALRDFSDEARDADIAIIYFAGHGIEIQGANYLIPVDAVLERETDAYDEAVSLDRLLGAVEAARQLRLIILDACRDNPFAKTMKRAVASRSVDRGLAKVEPMSLNTLVAFAAKAGSTADDGDARNSPFTTALVKYLPTPGLDVRLAFGRVRDDVLKVTHNRQEPFIYGSLGGNDVALVPKPAPPPQVPAIDPNAAAKADYELVSQINVVGAWDSFIKKYPSGFYSDLARAQRDKLIAASAAAAEQARQEAEKKARDDAKAAENARAAEAAKAEQAREAERQKTLAAAKAAEQARRDAERKAAEEARRDAAQKAADTAHAKAVQTQVQTQAQAQPETTTRLVAVLPGDGRLGQEVIRQKPPHSQSDCAGASAQLSSLDPTRALSLSEECALKPKDAFKECVNCPDMVVVPAGEFLMGSSKRDIDYGLAEANEGPQHKVTVRQSFAIGRFEVTRDQYAAFVDSTGYHGTGRCFTLEQNTPKERENRSFLMPGYAQEGNHPAVCVSWSDAQAYVDWLSKTSGKSYRLPSEAEYEYAARAGGTTRYGFTDDPTDLCRFANGADRAAKAAGLPEDAPYMACNDGHPFTAPVGSFAANSFGLHDLIGNVWEWTADCFADDYGSANSDSAPRPVSSCAARTVRGGDWFSGASSLRPAVRAKAAPDSHFDDIGFRVVRTLAH